MDTEHLSPVGEAVSRAGGLAPLARALGISKVAVFRWRKSGQVPAERVLAVEQITGVPRHRLRPDLYPESNGHARPHDDRVSPAAAAARSLGLDPEVIAAQAVRQAVGRERARRWAVQNRSAIEAHGRYVASLRPPLPPLEPR